MSPRNGNSFFKLVLIYARSARDSSSMTKMRSQRNESDVAEKTRSEDVLSARKKRLSWTRRIWISLGRLTLSGREKLQHR